jgi:hypothetical protein
MSPFCPAEISPVCLNIKKQLCENPAGTKSQMILIPK